ncbi:hypothetical protein [Falsiroseomonas selenitidurans]|uniref:Uncharacterized protein n=1 Tax=Falsiroseomonas selenitidurans TaxID=2716335 RepID=A0ABX1DZM6_9PROT|nr:hypothetical protein [Falsiroseomonas selenitidurans]NKC30365.1 hypothetical protein [Falsiroseomonas selenitidurans]
MRESGQPGRRRSGSAGRAVLGAVLGSLVGLPTGFLAYMVVRDLLLPTSLWSSDLPLWGVMGGVALAAAALGAAQGARPTRLGHALARGLGGFLGAAVLGGLGIGVLALVIGDLAGVSQREGAFAMGVAFTLVPLGGLACGLVGAVWLARRAWRRW